MYLIIRICVVCVSLLNDLYIIRNIYNIQTSIEKLKDLHYNCYGRLCIALQLCANNLIELKILYLR